MTLPRTNIYLDKYCLQCGTEMKNVYQNVRYCPECAALRKRESMARAKLYHNRGKEVMRKVFTKEEDDYIKKYYSPNRYMAKQIARDLNRSLGSVKGRILLLQHKGEL